MRSPFALAGVIIKFLLHISNNVFSSFDAKIFLLQISCSIFRTNPSCFCKIKSLIVLDSLRPRNRIFWTRYSLAKSTDDLLFRPAFTLFKKLRLIFPDKLNFNLWKGNSSWSSGWAADFSHFSTCELETAHFLLKSLENWSLDDPNNWGAWLVESRNRKIGIAELQIFLRENLNV